MFSRKRNIKKSVLEGETEDAPESLNMARPGPESGLLREVRTTPEDGEPDYPRVDSSELLQQPNFVGNLSVKFLKEHLVYPLRLDGDTLFVAIADPWDFKTLDGIKLATGYQLKVHVGEGKDILEAIERFYGSGATTMEKIIDDMRIGRSRCNWCGEHFKSGVMWCPHCGKHEYIEPLIRKRRHEQLTP